MKCTRFIMKKLHNLSKAIKEALTKERYTILIDWKTWNHKVPVLLQFICIFCIIKKSNRLFCGCWQDTYQIY